MAALLECRGLDVRFSTDTGTVAAVSGLDFDLAPGECLGIVGESGSGKSQTFLAMFGLLAANGTATGSVKYRGTEILNAPRAVLDELRGNRLAMVFQDALSGLTPTMRVGEQLAEVLVRHQGLSRADARARAIEALEIVRLPDAARRYEAYPFELSGGMRQRVMIAMASLCRPEVLVADECTTALDVTVQAQVLRLLDGMKRKAGTAIVLITHDLGVVAGLCDRVLIMYGGRAVEIGPVRRIFREPAHPYTRALLRSMPSLGADPAVDLPVIPGQPPDLENLPPGCAFAPRCTERFAPCQAERPALQVAAADHRSACHLGRVQ
ncbi:MAG: ABC transporter ATP-binding protein [Gammaproteobacteria bacterium]|nr:ABC transporter ATP-binding protein [Gammaproteobacteria bacterium]